MYIMYNTVDREIFTIEAFSPLSWSAKIEHTKIKHTMYYFNLLDFVVKIRHTDINYTKIFEREYFPIYGIMSIMNN